MHDSIDSSVVQTFTNSDNYKLTRACWWALYAPDAGRHGALEGADLPAPYRTLFDAILDGSKGLARVAAAGGEALDLLDVVAKLPRPSAIPTRRLELPDTPELAAALFGKFADELELCGGVGEWPAPPQHTCGARSAVGTVLTFRPNRTQAARMFNPTWRTCPACQHQRAKRIARQTLVTTSAIGPMTHTTMTAADYCKWTGRNRQHAHRGGSPVHYRAMPQEDGSVFVMATAGLAGMPVPTDRAQLHALIMAHCVTPEDHNTSSNRGYGGDWKRMRGDGRDDRDPAHIAHLRQEVTQLRRALSGQRAAVQRAKDKAARVLARRDEMRRIVGELGYWDGYTRGAWPPAPNVDALIGLLFDEVMRRLQVLHLEKKAAALAELDAAEQTVAESEGALRDTRDRLDAAVRALPRNYVQRWTDSALEDVAAALSVAMKPDADRINVQIDHTEALERLHLAGIALRDKKRRKSVTHLVQNSPHATDCTKCVTSGGADAQLRPLPYPTKAVTAAEEAAAWPTYSA